MKHCMRSTFFFRQNVLLLISIIYLVMSSCSNDLSNKQVELTDEFCKNVREYDEVGAFSEGYAPVRKGEKWGFIDVSGNEVIPCSFSKKGKFVGGYALVDKQYIDVHGEKATLSKSEIAGLKSLAQDTVSLIKFEKDGRWGYKNQRGDTIVPARYSGLGNFHNGVALAVLTTEVVAKSDDDFEFIGRAIPCYSGDEEYDKRIQELYEEVFIYGYVDTKGQDTFTADDFKRIEDKLHQREEEERKDREELERLMREGPDWLQGTWQVRMDDENGDFIGWMYNTFDHGKLTVRAGDMSFDYTYKLDSSLRSIEFGDGGEYSIIMGDKSVHTHDGQKLEKISELSSVSSDSSSPSSHSSSTSYASSRDKELRIMNQLHELGEKGKRMMPRIEALYRRQQQAQRQGILSNPQAQFDLNDAINELIDIKNEQIRLAEQLGDPQLVKEYKEQRSQIYAAKDRMLYGR